MKKVKVSGLSTELYYTDEEMLCEYIDTGMFNGIIQGYVKIAERVAAEVNDAAEEFDIKERMSVASLMPAIFDNYRAADALEALRGGECMTDDEKIIKSLIKGNSLQEETINRLLAMNECLKKELDQEKRNKDMEDDPTPAWRNYYSNLYYADRKKRIVYYWGGLAILAIVAAAAVMKILL